MTTPQRGFKAVASQLIRERPGFAAEEYARIALERGLASSNSEDPVWSLATTLAKEVREGRMPEVRAEKINGKLHYFQVDYPTEHKMQPRNGLRVEVMLPLDATDRVNVLVEIGRFRSPSEAVIWLLKEGLKAKQSALDRITTEVEEIRRRKESAQRLL